MSSVVAEPGLVVGLGNPGPKYADTRHNVGFAVVERLAARAGERFRPHKGIADVADGRVAGARVVLAKPRSYMNLSGGLVASVLRYYGVQPAAMIVVHDDLDLALGTIRVKLGGGEGGHNGLRSISQSLGTKDYLRARFGIGRPPGRMDPADYVLRRFTAAERVDVDLAVELCADAVEALLIEGLERTQNRFHALN